MSLEKYREELNCFQKENQGKKILVIYGNCHTVALKEYLQQLKPVTKEFAIYPFMPIQDIRDPNYLCHPVIGVCDIFIHQSIRLANRYGEAYASERIIPHLKPSCHIIAFPNLYHLPLCLFPQYSDKKEWVGRNGNTLFFRDTILDNAFSKGLSIKETEALYRGEENFPAYNFETAFSNFIEKVQIREKDWDIKVSRFILDNYQQHQLFFDPNHPAPFLLRYYAKSLLALLNLKVSADDWNKVLDFRLDSYEMPICGAVNRAYGIKYSSTEIRSTGYKVCKHKPMFFDDYVKQYWSLEWQNRDLFFLKRVKSFLQFVNYMYTNILRQ